MRIAYHVLNKNREWGEQRREDVRRDPAKSNELYSKHRLFEQFSCVLQQLIITSETMFLDVAKTKWAATSLWIRREFEYIKRGKNMHANDKC